MNKQFDNSINEQNNNNNDFIEIISLILHSRNQTHIYHWQTNSLAEHQALNDYYDKIVPLVDDLVESYQGKYDIMNSYKTYELNNYTDTSGTIKFYKTLFAKIEKLRQSCTDSYIQNQIDTVEQLITSTMYKLRFLSK
jgi:hypothetical protein